MSRTKSRLCELCGKVLPKESKSNRKYHKQCKRIKDKEFSEISKRKKRNKTKRTDFFEHLAKDVDFIKIMSAMVNHILRNTYFHINLDKPKSKSSPGGMIAFPSTLDDQALERLKHVIGQMGDSRTKKFIERSMKNQEKRDEMKESKQRNIEFYENNKEPTIKQLELLIKKIDDRIMWNTVTLKGLSQDRDNIKKQIDKFKKKVSS